jgi:hypothetical protein
VSFIGRESWRVPGHSPFSASHCPPRRDRNRRTDCHATCNTQLRSLSSTALFMFASPWPQPSGRAQLQATVLFNYSTDTLLKKLTPNALIPEGDTLKVQANSKDQRDALVKGSKPSGTRNLFYRDEGCVHFAKSS